MAASNTDVQKSLAWAMGTPELPGVRRRVYYTSKNDILVWPKLPHNEVGRVTSSVYDGSFTLKENAVWKYIDILPEKSQLTSEAQGELPSQTQLNKLVAVHPSVSEAASAAAAYLNNNDNVFIVEDMKGNRLLLFTSDWAIRWAETHNETLKLSEFGNI